MASLFKRNGVWWVVYYVNGKRCRVSARTRDKNLAKQKLNDIELKLFKGELGILEKKTQEASIPKFFRRYVEFMVNSSPADKHAGLSRIRILREFFAHKHIRYLNDITPGLLDEFRVEVLADRKPKTVKNYIALLRTALNKAVEWELIDLNPIANVKLPKIIKTFHFYSQKEIEILIREAFEPLKTGIILLVYTGMRRGELYHLRVRDVDLKAKSIRVWPYEGYSPKGKRPRTIPAATEIVEILQQLIHGKSPDDYMFRPYKCQHQLYKRFREFSQKLGIKGNLHNLRHTFASRLAMSGTPIPVIKDFLGHSDISTTMIYSHLSPNLYQTEIGKLQFKLK